MVDGKQIGCSAVVEWVIYGDIAISMDYMMFYQYGSKNGRCIFYTREEKAYISVGLKRLAILICLVWHVMGQD